MHTDDRRKSYSIQLAPRFTAMGQPAAAVEDRGLHSGQSLPLYRGLSQQVSEIRGQFHQRFMSNFYASRSQKCNKG